MNSTRRWRAAPRQASKSCHAAVSHDGDGIEIVHAGTAESAIGRRKSSGPDNMRLDSEAGTEARIVPVFCGISVHRERCASLSVAGAGWPPEPAIRPPGAGSRGVPGRPELGMFRWHTCTLSVRVPIKRRRISSLLISPRSDAPSLPPPHPLSGGGWLAARMV